MQVYYDTLDRPDLAQAEYERSKGLVGFGGRADHFALLRMLKSGTATEAQIRAQFETFLRNAPLPMKLDRDLAAHWQDQAAARSALRAELDTASNKDSTRLLILAMTADAFGDRQTALQALRRFAASKPLWYTIGGIWYSYGTGLRSDPEFKEVLRDLKLVDYYRAGGNWGDFCKPLGPDDFECH